MYAINVINKYWYVMRLSEVNIVTIILIFTDIYNFVIMSLLSLFC